MKSIASIFLMAALAFGIQSCKKAEASANSGAKAKEGRVNHLKYDKAKVAAGMETTLVSADMDSYDFGTVKEGDKVEHTFTLTNTGDKDLIIYDAKSTCGCTVPEVEKNVPIKPGATTSVKAIFNTQGKPNKQTKVVTITGNMEGGQKKLTLTGMVTPKAK